MRNRPYSTLFAMAIGLGLLLAAATTEAGAQVSFGRRGMPYDAFDKLAKTPLKVAGGTIQVAFAPGVLEVSQTEIMDWIKRSADAIIVYYGRFPVSSVRLLIVPVPGREVRHGQAFGYRGAAIRVNVGHGSDRAALARDWVLVHEMVHLALPKLARRHNWLSEGLATYVESIARVQAGDLSATFIWGGYARSMHHGLPKPGDAGLDNTPTWGRTYWGGALFCLLADIEIRKRTGNRFGLQSALRAILASGGNHEVNWPIKRALKIADKATGVQVLMEFYEKMRARPVDTDLAALWRRLGVKVAGRSVSLDNDAPQAAIRQAITAIAAVH